MADNGQLGQELTPVKRVDPPQECTALQVCTHHGLLEPPTDPTAREAWLRKVCDHSDLTTEQRMTLLLSANAIVVKSTGGVEETEKSKRRAQKTCATQRDGFAEDDGLGPKEVTVFGDGSQPVPSKVQMRALNKRVRQLGTGKARRLSLLLSSEDEVRNRFVESLGDKKSLLDVLWPKGLGSIWTRPPAINATFTDNDANMQQALTTLFGVKTDEDVQQINEFIANRMEQERGQEDLAFTGLDVSTTTQTKTVAWSETDFNQKVDALSQQTHFDRNKERRATTRMLTGHVEKSNLWREVSAGQEVVINTLFPTKIWYDLGVLFHKEVTPKVVILHIQLLEEWTGDDETTLITLVHTHKNRYWSPTALELLTRRYLTDDEIESSALQEEFQQWSEYQPMIRTSKDNDGKERKYLLLCIAHDDVEIHTIELDENEGLGSDWELACWNDYRTDQYFTIQVKKESHFALCFKECDDPSDAEDDDSDVKEEDAAEESKIGRVASKTPQPKLQLGWRRHEMESHELMRVGDKPRVDDDSDGVTDLDSEFSDAEQDGKSPAIDHGDSDLEIPSYPSKGASDLESIKEYYAAEATRKINEELHEATLRLTSAIKYFERVVEKAAIVPTEFNNMAQTVYHDLNKQTNKHRPTTQEVGERVRARLSRKRVQPVDTESSQQGESSRRDEPRGRTSAQVVKNLLKKRKRRGGGSH